MKTQAVDSAPAKVMLLGEHFVVHGEPAIVLAIERRATVGVKPRAYEKAWIRSNGMKASGHFPNNRFAEEQSGEAFIARKTMDGVRIEG